MKNYFLVLCTTCVQMAFAAGPGLSAAECEVWERERSFAQSVDRHDRQAFAEHVHENAVFGATTPETQRGRDAIVAAWSDIIEGKVRLEWRPHSVSLGAGTHVAMSRGPYVLQGKDKEGKARYGIGEFVSVWIRKDENSPWYVVLDGGGPPPKDATAEEASKHLASAPASCPRS